MNLVDKEIENWIKPFATIIGEKIDVDINLKTESPAKYFLRLTQPNKFDSYAIALHSFWINNKIPKNEIRKIENNDPDLPEEEFIRINWKKFYEKKENEFDLNKAILNSVNVKYPFEQMNNELYPGDGMMDIKHIESLVEVINEFYGNQEIELFFTFLATKDWKKDLMYNGKINDLPDLLKKGNFTYTPSLIYPKDKNWVVNTDYDLTFSTIGGDTEFINKVVELNTNEIIKVEY